MPSFLDEACRVAREFELSEKDVQAATGHFVRQLSIYHLPVSQLGQAVVVLTFIQLMVFKIRNAPKYRRT
jgi:hypothetical protein